MSFQKNKYCVIKEAVPKDIALFVYNYFLLKRTVANTLFKHRYISKFTEEWVHGQTNKFQILIRIIQI